jgi:hypothetical protein
MIRTTRNKDTSRSLMLAATFAVALSALLPDAAMATSVRLVNYVAYTYSGNSATLSTDGVENLDANNPSDALRLELWAFSSPYVPGMSGYRLAKFGIPPLDAGFLSGKIASGPVPFTRPPDGVWYFSMLLTEFVGVPPANDGYVERYAINIADPEFIGVPPPPIRVNAVEFYHAGYDHYFVAASAQDIIDLDTGVHPGWSRTGYSFDVWNGTDGRTNPVCRYYIPPGYGDSHFFSAAPDECAIALVKFPWLVKETDAAFYIALPDPSTGACAGNEVGVYRLWNSRPDSNHRYTTSAVVKATMIAAGYVAEGYGPDQVDMCAPQ